MTKTIVRSPSQEEVAEQGVTPNQCNDFVCIEKEERKSLPTPPRSRSPSPTNVARDAAAQQIFIANEIKAILRHPVARKPFFEFFRTLNQVNLLYFWLDVELLNNEDVVAEDEILSAVENLYEKYFSPFASSQYSYMLMLCKMSSYENGCATNYVLLKSLNSSEETSSIMFKMGLL